MWFRRAEPEWWLQAVALERQDRLPEAEEVVRSALAKIGGPWDCQCSYLYELRARRLLKEGKTDAAREAAVRAVDLIRQYASGATSGGEGIALSREADKVEAGLGDILSLPPGSRG